MSDASSKPEGPSKPRKYDDAFKLHAVALVVDQGRKVRDVARDLGVSEFLLYGWRGQLRPRGALPSAATSPEPAVATRRIRSSISSERSAIASATASREEQ